MKRASASSSAEQQWSVWLHAWFDSTYVYGIGRRQPCLNLPPCLVEIEGTEPPLSSIPLNLPPVRVENGGNWSIGQC
jgi:hypothetical protein